MNGLINIYSNAILQDIIGLVNIDPTTINTTNINGIDITIKDNPLLSSCNVKSICEALDIPSLTYLVENNNTNCNSAVKIMDNCCPYSLLIVWNPVLSGTYRSAGNIYFNSNLNANQNIILSHGQDSTVIFAPNMTVYENATLDVQNTGCN